MDQTTIGNQWLHPLISVCYTRCQNNSSISGLCRGSCTGKNYVHKFKLCRSPHCFACLFLILAASHLISLSFCLLPQLYLQNPFCSLFLLSLPLICVSLASTVLLCQRTAREHRDTSLPESKKKVAKDHCSSHVLYCSYTKCVQIYLTLSRNKYIAFSHRLTVCYIDKGIMQD